VHWKQTIMATSQHDGISLTVSRQQTTQGLSYQLLEIELTKRDRVIYPEALTNLQLPPEIDTTIGIVVSGRAPIWLYGYLVHELHPTAWVAFYEPRRQAAIVVSTHSRLVNVGEAIALPSTSKNLCAAVMVVGPPDSGKSVFSHALFQALLPEIPNIYLQRANWDGEGNYILELPKEADGETFKRQHKGELTEEFFPYHAQAILQLRRQKSLVIVDVGGMVQPEKKPILESCSHYIIISSDPEQVDVWHEFCRDRGNLSPIAVIHSTLSETETIYPTKESYLEITCGPWIRSAATAVPQILLEKIRNLAIVR